MIIGLVVLRRRTSFSERSLGKSLATWRILSPISGSPLGEESNGGKQCQDKALSWLLAAGGWRLAALFRRLASELAARSFAGSKAAEKIGHRLCRWEGDRQNERPGIFVLRRGEVNDTPVAARLAGMPECRRVATRLLVDHLGRQFVTDAPDGLDQTRFPGIVLELPAQLADQHVHASVVG